MPKICHWLRWVCPHDISRHRGGGDDQPPHVVLSEGVYAPVMPASKPKPNGIARYQKPSVSLSPCVASFMFPVSDPDRLSPPAQVCMCRLNGTSNIVFFCEIASIMRVVITYIFSQPPCPYSQKLIAAPSLCVIFDIMQP